MKPPALLTLALLAATTVSATAAQAQTAVKAPTLMSDAQMKKVVAGTHGVGPGYGICTATFKADAPGARNRFHLDNLPATNLPHNGIGVASGNPAGFGLFTAGRANPGCFGGE